MRGLSNSSSTLKHLDAFGFGVTQNKSNDWVDYSSLTDLETLCVDSSCVFHRLECKDIDLQITFPPNVKSIQLIDDNEVATLLPESISAQLLVSSALPES